jgi:glycosyltransferase involved in cell wall biosynthesis
LVSVLLPVYNSENYLKEALDSVLNQTVQNFEIIIIDDGSTDNSKANIIDIYKDQRIHYYRNEKNLGLPQTLNLGLKKCKGKFIARMDADDISFPNRFEKQIEFLESNRDIALVGSAYISLKGNKNMGFRPQVTNHKKLKSKLLFGNNICHPSVMFNSTFINKHDLFYDPKFRYAQDYNLWTKLILKGYKLDNISEPLIYYRRTKENSDAIKSTITNLNFQRTIEKYISFLFPALNEMEVNKAFYLLRRPENLKWIDAIRIYNKLIFESMKIKNFDQLDFSLRLSNQLRKNFLS